jgi:hypothetical protein
MPFTHTVSRNVSTLGTSVGGSETITAGAQLLLDEPIPNGSTNLSLVGTLDVSQIRSIFILSTQDVVLETNSGSSPANTINLVANKPYIWSTGDYSSLLLTTDVTGFFVTNATANVATFTLYALYDTTI